MFLLDTNVIIGVLREAPQVLENYRALPPKIPKAITTFSVAELYEGLNLLTQVGTQEAQKRILEHIFDAFDGRNLILTLTRQGAKRYAQLSVSLRKHGTPIPVIDLLIGTIALLTNSTLITTDKNHFQLLKTVEATFQVEFWG